MHEQMDAPMHAPMPACTPGKITDIALAIDGAEVDSDMDVVLLLDGSSSMNDYDRSGKVPLCLGCWSKEQQAAGKLISEFQVRCVNSV